MESAITAFLIYLLPAFVILVPFEAQRIGVIALANARQIRLSKRLWMACVDVASGLVVGVIVGAAVMFGPSFLSNDFVGLPWLTSLPAIILGILCASKTSKSVSEVMIWRALRQRRDNYS